MKSTLGSAALYVLLVSSVACDGSEPLGGPSTPPTPGTVTPRVPIEGTIGGVVIERHLNITVDEKNLYAWIEGEERFFEKRTDNHGRYLVQGLRPGSRVWFNVALMKKWAQCALVATAVNGHVDYDIFVSDRSITAPHPVQDPPGFRTISGLAFELTPSGPIAAAGASVHYWVPSPSSSTGKRPVAWTDADADGRFHLCGLPQASGGEVKAFRSNTTDTGGRSGVVAVPPGPSTDVSIEIKFDEPPQDYYLRPLSR